VALSSRTKKILDRLTASLRGQIFLCNLDAGITSGLIDAGSVYRVLKTVKARDVTRMHDSDLLGHLKALLQHPSANLMLRNDRTAHFSDFACGEPLVTTMRREDFDAFYAHSADLIGGHAFAVRTVGSSTVRFRPSATTNPVVWVAPRRCFVSRTIVQSDAEAVRDTLGLVHHGKRVPLVAMHFQPPSDSCFRPTAIEAMPNPRFRQNDPLAVGELRWGATVNLDLLDVASSGASVAGMPELALSRVGINTCSNVEFFDLGETKTDRDTYTTDMKFLERLLNAATIDVIVARLEGHLTI